MNRTSLSIGDEAARRKEPLRKFGSATRLVVTIPRVSVTPAKLDPTLWEGYEEWLAEQRNEHDLEDAT